MIRISIGPVEYTIAIKISFFNLKIEFCANLAYFIFQYIESYGPGGAEVFRPAGQNGPKLAKKFILFVYIQI